MHITQEQASKLELQKGTKIIQTDTNNVLSHMSGMFLGFSVISVSFFICMLTLLLMPLAGLHFCVGNYFIYLSL
jgi:hypothetical protein